MSASLNKNAWADLSEHARSLIKLGFPLIFGQLAVMAMGVTDAVIAGHYSTADLAGISLASGVWAPLIVAMITLVTAVNPFLARYYGAGHLIEMGVEARQGLWVALFAGCIIAVVALVVIPLLSRLNTDQQAVKVAENYLVYILFGAPALGMQIVLRGVCESSGYPRITVQLYGGALVVNAILDYVFVYGKLGLPAMGGAGCGLASAIVYWLIMLAAVAHLMTHARYREIGLFTGSFRFDRQRLLRILKLGLPMSVGGGAEVGFFSVLVMMVASHGAVALAAHQIATSFTGVLFMIPLGLAMALTIKVSHALGAGQAENAATYARAGILIVIAIGAVNSLLTVVLAPYIVALYSNDSAVIAVAQMLLYLVAAFQIADGLQVVSNGALRGYRDTFKPMLLMLAAFWGVGLAFAVVFGYDLLGVGSGGVVGFWYGAIAALSAACLFLALRLRWVSRRELQ